jgi:regulator of protease activity HflC (stomatin/prohibitin superfamily)
MRALATALCVMVSGCAAVIEPGHRGLLFDPSSGGLQHEVLQPGRHSVGLNGHIEDFDVTYSTQKAKLECHSKEALPVEVEVSVIYRPIVAELYALATELGPGYAEEVVIPEFRVATRAVIEQHPIMGLQAQDVGLESEIEQTLRRRISGKHIEISAVTVQAVALPAELKEAIARKAAAKRDAEAVRLEADDACTKLRAELEAKSRELDRMLAEERKRVGPECNAAGDCQCRCN